MVLVWLSFWADVRVLTPLNCQSSPLSSADPAASCCESRSFASRMKTSSLQYQNVTLLAERVCISVPPPPICMMREIPLLPPPHTQCNG